jgi:hypothetical protein
MYLPFQKCSCCGKRVGLKEWWRCLKILQAERKKIAEEVFSKFPNLSILECNEIINIAMVSKYKELFNHNQ